jgi:tetratricopeptide (TPR) repeat protein
MAHRAEVAQDVIKYKLRVRNFYLEYRNKEKLPSLEKALKKLQIERLKKQTGESDVERSSAAKRMLATAFVNTGFYEPRDYFNKKDYVRAAGLLRIASAIYPNVPRVCYQLARAATQLGELDEALEALECGRNAEWATDELIESDELLAPLLSDERYSKRGS